MLACKGLIFLVAVIKGKYKNDILIDMLNIIAFWDTETGPLNHRVLTINHPPSVIVHDVHWIS